MRDRRKKLRQLYGFDFPEDLFRFWEFVNRVQPLDPLNALWESLRMSLVGPFEVLAGRFDKRRPRHSQLLHWRYYDDPPEFFTVFAGDTDGLHWGYVLDDPHDHGRLAWALTQLLDPSRRAACGQAGRRAAAQWTFEHHYRHILAVFAEAAARKKAA